MSTSYYAGDSTDVAPQTLLRRADFVDEVFMNGTWQPTKAIVDFLFGHNDSAETISEVKAREIAPSAFR